MNILFSFLHADVGCSSSLSAEDHVGSYLAAFIGEYRPVTRGVLGGS